MTISVIGSRSEDQLSRDQCVTIQHILSVWRYFGQNDPLDLSFEEETANRDQQANGRGRRPTVTVSSFDNMRILQRWFCSVTQVRMLWQMNVHFLMTHELFTAGEIEKRLSYIV